MVFMLGAKTIRSIMDQPCANTSASKYLHVLQQGISSVLNEQMTNFFVPRFIRQIQLPDLKSPSALAIVSAHFLARRDKRQSDPTIFFLSSDTLIPLQR
jgi:hypothetical protein